MEYSALEVRQALRPLASLISKSEKAQLKLAPSTWQYAMLRDNLKALHIAAELMGAEPHGLVRPSRDDLREALHALASMIGRTEASQSRFSPGTSQHSLQRNRLKALRIAEALVRIELERG